MILKSVLEDAKSFLCWDCFPELTVQLIPMRLPVSYYYPPGEKHSIVIFYDMKEADFSKPLFSLFHEAGHYQQFMTMGKKGQLNSFWAQIDIPDGPERAAFEKDSWERGSKLLVEFIKNRHLDIKLLEMYNQFAHDQVKSYSPHSSTGKKDF